MDLTSGKILMKKAIGKMTSLTYYPNNSDLTHQFDHEKAQIISNDELTFKIRQQTFMKKKSTIFSKN